MMLAAAAAIRSEGAVHSHARRAIKAGASAEGVRHTIMLLNQYHRVPDGRSRHDLGR